MGDTRFINYYNPYNPFLNKTTKIQVTSKSVSPFETIKAKYSDSLRDFATYETTKINSYDLKLLKILNDLHSYLRLEENWDNYGASRVSVGVVKNVFGLLLSNLQFLPSISPSGSNSIVMIFTKDDTELIIEVFENSFGFANIKNDLSEYYEKSNLDFDSTKILNIVRNYYGLYPFFSK